MNNGPKTRATIDINLIKIFSAGPDVSLNGSPTVSPTTAAECASDPLPPKLPASIYFFALSHAPPALAIIIANKNPEAIDPIRRPPNASAPSIMPTAIGVMIESNPGQIIALIAPWVLIPNARV